MVLRRRHAYSHAHTHSNTHGVRCYESTDVSSALVCTNPVPLGCCPVNVFRAVPLRKTCGCNCGGGGGGGGGGGRGGRGGRGGDG